MLAKHPKGLWKYLLFAGLPILIFTFPFLFYPIEGGLDTGYEWALNCLFAHNKEQLGAIVHAYGPLGFLNFPLGYGHNLEWALFFHMLYRSLMIVSLLWLGLAVHKKQRWLVIVCILFIMGNLAMQFIMPIWLMGLLLLHYYKQGRLWLIIAGTLLACAYLIKVSTGFLCLVIILPYLLLLLYKLKFKAIVILGLAYLGTSLVFSFLFFGGPINMVSFLAKSHAILLEFGETMVLPAKNNAWLLLAALALVGLIPLFWRTKATFLVYFIGLLSLYSMYKYGIGRQDAVHMQRLVYYLSIFFLFLILANRSFSFRALGLMILSTYLLFLNFNSIRPMAYKPLQAQPANLIKALTEFQALKNRQLSMTQEAFKELSLPNEWVSKIGNSTVDIYPWNLCVAANHGLNYLPRPTLQTISTSEILAASNAEHYASATGPEFIIWLKQADQYGYLFKALDYGYLFTQDPLTTLSILEHYQLVDQNVQYMLFEKRAQSVDWEWKQTETYQLNWNEWHSLTSDNPSRIAADISFNMIGKLGKQAYKAPLCYIELKLEDGSYRKYRLLRKNAALGMLINPIIDVLPGNGLTASPVVAFRFVASDYKFFDSEIAVKQLETGNMSMLSEPPQKGQLLLEEISQDTVSIAAGEFFAPASWSIPLSDSSIYMKEVVIESGGHVHGPLKLVFQIIDGDENQYWYDASSIPLHHQGGMWEYLALKDTIDLSSYRNGELRVFWWSEYGQQVQVSDFQLRISLINH